MRTSVVLSALLLSACFRPAPCSTDSECGGPGGQCDPAWGFCVTTGETGGGDGGVADAGAGDSGVVDAGEEDGGIADAGVLDAGVPDSGVIDAGAIDAGIVDAGPIDAGPIDAGPIDAGPIDAGPPPAVTATNPLASATNVAPDVLLTATFDEPMETSTLTPSTFTLVGASALGGVVSLDGGTRATFAPDLPLDTNRIYTATVTTGARSLGGLALPQNHSWTFTTALLWVHSAQTFSVLGASVTNTGPTTLAGDLGVSTGTPLMGGATIAVGGASHLNDTAAAEAHADLATAYAAAGALTATGSLATLDGRTLNAGIYTSNSAALALNTSLTLDGQGNPDAVFIFQIDAALNTGATTSNITLIRGARAANVFWQVSGAVTLGAGSSFKGTVLGLAAITVGAGTTVQGRMLSLNGTVTLASNTISN